jgi:hypothetical protein
MNAMSANFLKTLDMTGHSKDDIVHGRGLKPMNTRQGDKGQSDGSTCGHLLLMFLCSSTS